MQHINNSDILDTFMCPITLEIMKDPVICSDGITYEKSAIEEWLTIHSTSPVTRLPIKKKLIKNIILRNIIATYLENKDNADDKEFNDKEYNFEVSKYIAKEPYIHLDFEKIKELRKQFNELRKQFNELQQKYYKIKTMFD